MSVERIHRLLRLITILQGGGASHARDLMAVLRVSRRTLFRYLNMLQSAGIPCYYEPKTGYRIAKGYYLPPINLTVPETLGLMLLAKSAAAHKHRFLFPAALSAIMKLTSTVPDSLRTACIELMARVSVDAGATAAKAASDAEALHYPALQRAIDEGRVCELVYKSPVEAQVRTRLDPYLLHFAARAWYVMGRSETHGEIRVFKLSRILSVEPLSRRFTPPKKFRASDKLGKAWLLNPEGKTYHVELEFMPKVATNVAEVLWHPTQKFHRLDDGRCVMTFEIDGLGEIAWWVCGYADQVMVKKPPALRKHVRAMLQSASDRYAGV